MGGVRWGGSWVWVQLVYKLKFEGGEQNIGLTI